MHTYILRTITILAALSVSGLSAVMAWASAMQRSTDSHDRLVFAVLGLIIGLLVHFLPAILRKRSGWVLWPVWTACLAVAAFGHASWFYLSSSSAAEARHAGSAAVRAVADERQQIEQTLSTIRARPVSTVAAQLARTNDDARRTALAAELAEAKRAAGLRDRLIRLSRNTPVTGQGHQEQPGTAQEQSGTLQERDVTLVIAVVAALLLEVLGALLWREVFARDDEAAEPVQVQSEPAPTVVQQVVNFIAPTVAQPVQIGGVEVVDELADLRAAIARGECRESVRSIRDYMGCGMDKASSLRRQLLVQ